MLASVRAMPPRRSCEQIAAFGWPVVPEVKINKYGASGSSAMFGSGAPAKRAAASRQRGESIEKRRSGATFLVGAGLGLAASVGGRRWLRRERQRVQASLATARPAFEQLRSAWLEGKLERDGRDAAARRLIEETVLTLRQQAPSHQETPE